MFAIILIAVFMLIAIILLASAGRWKNTEYNESGPFWHRLIAGVLTLTSVVIFLFSTLYTQSVGEAKVIVNVDGTIAGEKLVPGWGFKAPWQDSVDWDLFAQQATYAGNSESGTPSYTGGEVNGYEITTAVAGGAQVNFDLSVTYSLDADLVTELYEEFRSQERFTSQIVNQQILSVTRDIPSQYTPVEFRGEKRGEATVSMQEALNASLGKYGIEISVVNLQNIRYTEEVEVSIKNVEVAQQKEEEALANLRATEVSAQAQIVEAEAEAKANALRAASITPELIELNRVAALLEAAKNGSLIVVPDGSSPLIQVAK